MAVLVPLLAFAAIIFVLLGRQQERAMEALLWQTVSAAAEDVAQQIASDRVALESLAASPALDGDDLTAFREHAGRVFRASGHWLTLIVTDHERQILNLLVPPGHDLPPIVDPQSLETVLRTGQPTVGDLLPYAGGYAVPIRVPVMRGGLAKYTLAIFIRPEVFTRLLIGARPPDGWVLALWDRNRTYVGRSRGGAQFTGTPLPMAYQAELALQEGRIFRTVSRDGVPTYSGFLPVTGTQWQVGVGAPVALVEGPYQILRRSTWIGGITAAAAAVLLMAVLLAALRRRHVAEQKLLAMRAERELEQRLGDIAANFPGAIYRRELRPDGAMGYTYLSRNAKALLGAEVEDVTGWKPLSVVGDRLTDTERTKWLDALRRSAKTMEPFDLQLQVPRPDGGTRDIRTLASPHRREDGTIVWDGIAMDMTDLENARRELARARDEAESANEAKSKFLAVASHDLRQPVQSMLLFSSALGAHIATEQGREMLHFLQHSLETLKSLLDSLLDMSRLDGGAVTPQPEDIALADLLDTLSVTYAPIAQRKGLGWHVAGGDDAVVRSDPVLLGRILRNLVENAFRYTEAGQVSVHASLDGPQQVRIEVRDTGVGIPPDSLDRIFEEFHQVDDGRGAGRHGLGLGLSIVRRLAQLLGHPIEVQSAVGEGSVFAVIVPLAVCRTGDVAA
ncbi:MAG TPA: ATP-binding protein [Azospirillum sp.]|nr:ATP-binding protein [Azospirillum sp.]